MYVNLEKRKIWKKLKRRDKIVGHTLRHPVYHFTGRTLIVHFTSVMIIHFLGTASCFPSPHRGVSCTALKFSDGDVWIFDCGEGSQIQLQRSSLKASKISKIFITHLHGDHIFGLPGLMCTIGSQIPDRVNFTLEIYGPHGLRKYLRQSLSLSRSPLPYNYIVHELIPNEKQFPDDWCTWEVNHSTEDNLHPQELLGQDLIGDDVWNIIDNEKLVVKAGPILHRIPCFGYVITEKDQPGTLNVKKLKELGISPGPIYGELKKGQSVTLSDGRIVMPSQVLGANKKGRKITILGDTHDPSLLRPLAMFSDVLVHEATMEDALREKAISFGHSTPSMAAQFAESITAKMLVLFHFSQRFRVSDMEADDQNPPTIKLLEEALAALNEKSSCKVILAEDLKSITIERDKS